MTSSASPKQAAGRLDLAVWFGGMSVACWCCCPFWLVVWVFALPMGITGLTRGIIEYRAAARERASTSRAVAGTALSLVGSGAAVAYMIFVFTHPDLPIQE
ncbi:hypothetical protein PV703_14720 [Streptomyces sp. ME01-24h]|nr:hypothetical protein [Streptomyces sp. ME19-03-3]MDX3214246.1 hypothetical protein [Streptomyces sp. ME02-6991-2B]MDX3354537.1 hypothetical protein [Streptomyces sp. ME01-24h]